jgi:hypothetical protein
MPPNLPPPADFATDFPEIRVKFRFSLPGRHFRKSLSQLRNHIVIIFSNLINSVFPLARWHIFRVAAKSMPIVIAARVLLGSVGAADEPKKAVGASPEEFCVLIEPAEGPQVVKLISGSKLTGLVPGRETHIGVRYYSAAEYTALGMSWPEFVKRSESAAARQLAKLTPEITRDAKGFVRFAVLRGKSHLTASSVFAPEFRSLFKSSMGDDLIVLIPNRFTIYVFPRGMGEYKDFGKRILSEYEDSPFPVSYEVLLLNRDGLSCLGSFRTE